jgi:hypothetical protein
VRWVSIDYLSLVGSSKDLRSNPDHSGFVGEYGEVLSQIVSKINQNSRTFVHGGSGACS